MQEKAERDKLADLAIQAAIKASKLIMEIYTSDFQVETKLDQSPVTIADRGADDIIREMLKSSGIYVLSEEQSPLPYAERKDLEQLWIVDPLDGTKEFIRRNGEFTVNIALVEQGRPVMGIITTPVFRELFVGIVGEGAWRVDDYERSGPADMALVRKEGKTLPMVAYTGKGSFVGSISHKVKATDDMFGFLLQHYPEGEVWDIGSSIKFCKVAEGTADAYPRYAPINEWDMAAGEAILVATGGQILGTSNGQPLGYNKSSMGQPQFIAFRKDFVLPEGFFEFAAKLG